MGANAWSWPIAEVPLFDRHQEKQPFVAQLPRRRLVVLRYHGPPERLWSADNKWVFDFYVTAVLEVQQEPAEERFVRQLLSKFLIVQHCTVKIRHRAGAAVSTKKLAHEL